MNLHKPALLIAEALHAVEADPAFAAAPHRFKAKVSRLHRHLHEAALANEAALGLDVTLYSGGTPKELPQ